jgi:hypothetical protein
MFNINSLLFVTLTEPAKEISRHPIIYSNIIQGVIPCNMGYPFGGADRQYATRLKMEEFRLLFNLK